MHGKSDRRAFRVDFRAEKIRAADPADKIDALARARIFDAEDRREDFVLQQAHIESRNWIGTRGNFEIQSEPVPSEIHRDLSGLGGRGLGGWRECAGVADPHEKFLGMQSVQIGNEPVVRKNFELVLRENHRGEPVVILLAGMVRIGFAFGQSDACRAGRAVMSVGNVAVRDRGERFRHRIRVRHAPERVPDSVRCGEIEERIRLGRMLHQFFDLRIRFEGEKNRFDVRGKSRVESHAIVFLVRPGLLVFFDQARRVVVGMANRGDSGLRVIAHDLPVEIDLR